ncbi:hypothetical protein [Hydrogenophaga sp.]|uniref:hypothetical protein n=1 Tax=Hydrogenophaga sp. TaxID=1904254 RepID=UPI0027228C6C|nr:hypothetical protein [Hydrogenophaga sp.]MDO9435031.1 hypothetical protein [Hydrogenophaga sp.]
MHLSTPGTTSPNGITGATRPQGPPAAPKTPQEILKGLTSKIESVDPGDVTEFVKHLADGTVARFFPPGIPVDFFSLMIEAGDHELFVATFDLYHQLLNNATAPGDAPPKRTLVLSLPLEWNPPYGELDAALREARIERLQVRPYDEFSLEHGGVSDRVPEAACHCIATVLSAGATDLIIGGSLEDPEAIATAVANSRLRWLAITKLPLGPFGADDVEDYRKIVRALGRCPTLKHLSIAQSELIALHPVIGTLHERNGPKLVSIGLGVNPSEGSDPEIDITPLNAGDIRAFMDSVSKIPTLRVCRMRSVRIENPDSLANNILIPLGKSPSLTVLDFKGQFTNPTFADRVVASQKVAAFIVACPSLKDLKVDLESPSVVQGRVSRAGAGPAFHNYLQTHGNLPFSVECLSLAAMIASKHCKLQNVSLRGLYIPPTLSTAAFGALEHNTSVLHVDVQGCFLSLPSLAVVPEALKHNRTVEAFWVPQTIDNYFVVMEGGEKAIGFHLSEFRQLGVLLVLPDNASLAEQDYAHALLPEWRAQADTLFKVTVDKPRANRRAPFADRAQPELIDRAQTFLSAALKSAPGEGREADRAAFFIPATTLVKHFSDMHDLPSAIHLSEVTASRTKGALPTQAAPYVPSEDLHKVIGYFDNVRAEQEAIAQRIEFSKPRRDIEDFRDDVPEEAVPAVQPPQDIPLGAREAQLYQQAWTQIALGDVEALVAVLAQGAPVNVMDASQRKNALLMLAVATGDERLVQALLDYRAIDFGGHAETNAPTSALAAAFRPAPETNITTTANVTTTTTTTTATATMTSTATTTVPVDTDY